MNQGKIDTSQINFSDIIQFTMKILGEQNQLNEAQILSEKYPWIKEYSYMPAMLRSKINGSIFSGIIEKQKKGFKGIGILSINNSRIKYFGQVTILDEVCFMNEWGKYIGRINNIKFTGKFKKGKITGHGVMEIEKKNASEVCQVNPTDKVIEGKGEFSFPQEQKIPGNIINNVMENARILTQDGQIYCGRFNKALSGRGFQMNNNGSNTFSFGDFVDGKLQGSNLVMLCQSGLYIGGCLNGQKEGLGVNIHHITLEITFGKWKSGELDEKMKILSSDKLVCELKEKDKLAGQNFPIDSDKQKIEESKEEEKKA